MERSTAGTKEKRSPDGLTYQNQNTIIINIICQYFITDEKKHNETQLTKNKMDLNNRKIKNYPPSPMNSRILL